MSLASEAHPREEVLITVTDEANMKLADKGIVDVGGEDLAKLLEEKGLKNNIIVLKAFKQIGYEHGDDYIREGGVSVGKEKEGIDFDEVYPSMKNIPKRS